MRTLIAALALASLAGCAFVGEWDFPTVEAPNGHTLEWSAAVTWRGDSWQRMAQEGPHYYVVRDADGRMVAREASFVEMHPFTWAEFCRMWPATARRVEAR